MPNYRFGCDTCGAEMLVFYPVDDAPGERECEKCKGRMVKLVPSRIHVNCNRLDFVTPNITGEPVRISTQRQLNTLMDRHGVVRVGSDEITTNASKKNRRRQAIEDAKRAAKLPRLAEHLEMTRQAMGLEWDRGEKKKRRKAS